MIKLSDQLNLIFPLSGAAQSCTLRVWMLTFYNLLPPAGGRFRHHQGVILFNWVGRLGGARHAYALQKCRVLFSPTSLSLRQTEDGDAA